MKTIFNTAIGDFTEGDKEGIGTLRREGNKTYKWVKFDNGDAIAAAVGQAVGYKKTGYATCVVTPDISETDSVPAGVMQAVVPDGYYCWIQIKGPCTLATTVTSGADGAPFVFGADGVFVKSALTGNAQVNEILAGWSDDDSGKIVVLTCPE